jgi:hypothetical protein
LWRRAFACHSWKRQCARGVRGRSRRVAVWGHGARGGSGSGTLRRHGFERTELLTPEGEAIWRERILGGAPTGSDLTVAMIPIHVFKKLQGI